MRLIITPALAVLGLLNAGLAQAELPFTHPATAVSVLKVSARQEARDAAPVLMGHAASPRWTTVHANQEHPALAQARRARTVVIDTNAYRVQPPAAVRWTQGPAEPLPLALLGQ
jgi:hypothetical protein